MSESADRPDEGCSCGTTTLIAEHKPSCALMLCRRCGMSLPDHLPGDDYCHPACERPHLDDRPAGDRAQPVQELREAIRDWLIDSYGEHPVRDRDRWFRDTDALIAGPLAALLDAQAAVSRVRKLRHVWTRDGSEVVPSANLRRALDGT